MRIRNTTKAFLSEKSAIGRSPFLMLVLRSDPGRTPLDLIASYVETGARVTVSPRPSPDTLGYTPATAQNSVLQFTPRHALRLTMVCTYFGSVRGDVAAISSTCRGFSPNGARRSYYVLADYVLVE